MSLAASWAELLDLGMGIAPGGDLGRYRIGFRGQTTTNRYVATPVDALAEGRAMHADEQEWERRRMVALADFRAGRIDLRPESPTMAIQLIWENGVFVALTDSYADGNLIQQTVPGAFRYRQGVVLAEIADGLEVWRNSPLRPDQLKIPPYIPLHPPAQRDAVHWL